MGAEEASRASTDPYEFIKARTGTRSQRTIRPASHPFASSGPKALPHAVPAHLGAGLTLAITSTALHEEGHPD